MKTTPRFRPSAISQILIVALLAPMLLTLAGCKDSDYTAACKASDDIASGVSAVRDLSEQLYSTYHLIDKDEVRAIQLGAIDAAAANKQFRNKLRAVKTINGDTKTQIGAWVGEVLTSLEALEQNGTLHIKNESARSQLAIAFKTIRVAIATIQALAAANGIALPAPRVFAASPAFSSSTRWYAWTADSTAPAPAPAVITPAFDVDETCGKNAPDNLEARRCPKRASIVAVNSGGGN
jgi:hypothetical protein